MKRCCEIREVLVKISFIGATQLFATIGIALGRDEPPASPVRPWAPPTLPRYEGELRQYQPSIIGDRGRGDTPNSSDGVVPYWSSHLPDAQSELIVNSDHGAQYNPNAIREVERILKLSTSPR
jgi:hypothetical protein